MDVVSHALWGGIAFGRKNKSGFWTATAIGMGPDIFSFGMLWLVNLLGFYPRPDWSGGHPDPKLIPPFVHNLYDLTHSFVVFLIVFGLVWVLRKKPLWVLGAWGVHILIDIPSHSKDFFPTPFLWPISGYEFNGINWGNPVIFFPNVVILFILYSWFLINRYLSSKKI